MPNPANIVQLYINIQTKQIISYQGSPTVIPDQYYGDKPTFQLFPVIVNSSNPAQTGTASVSSVSYAGYTADFTMAGMPNATSPPTPFAQVTGLTWNATLNCFQGQLDLTQAAVGTFIGANAQAAAWFNFDVMDATGNRTTLFQGAGSTFNMIASIDSVTPGPVVPGQQVLTLQQALALFVLIQAVQGKFIVFKSPDGMQQKTLSLGNDGTEKWQ